MVASHSADMFCAYVDMTFTRSKFRVNVRALTAAAPSRGLVIRSLSSIVLIDLILEVMSVRTYVLPSVHSFFFNLHLIWCFGRPRPRMRTSMTSTRSKVKVKVTGLNF